MKTPANPLAHNAIVKATCPFFDILSLQTIPSVGDNVATDAARQPPHDSNHLLIISIESSDHFLTAHAMDLDNEVGPFAPGLERIRTLPILFEVVTTAITVL